MEQQIIDLKDIIEGKDREIKKFTRINDKMKRDMHMLKEEISILGAGTNNYQSEQENNSVKAAKTGAVRSGRSKQRRENASGFNSPMNNNRLYQSDNEEAGKKPFKSSYQNYVDKSQRRQLSSSQLK